MNDPRPRVALTMGDVAGVGPEVIARAWESSPLLELARPVVVGSAEILERAVRLGGFGTRVQTISHPSEGDAGSRTIPCLDLGGTELSAVEPGRNDARAGRAAYEFLNTAIDLALAGEVDAITTLPLNKESLHAAGVQHPGHTEILAERCGVADQAMMLYLPEDDARKPGLGVVHATLHVALREVFSLLTIDRVLRTIERADEGMRPLTASRSPRIGVAGLNPHAGENGLFGDEEQTTIRPAVERARGRGIDVVGPISADTLFARALSSEFDAVVAMYHDQGHVAIKTIGFDRAVNVTLGLPIVRTSVAHGTAFDIAWQNRADTASLIAAVRVAAQIVAGRRALTSGSSAPAPSRS